MSDFIYVAGKNDEDARARAFYLLKKYTSATLLRKAINIYREFLRDFEREISRPEVNVDYGGDLVRFLRFLQPMEYAEPLLENPMRRVEAFNLLRDGVKFSSYIWGRRYEELGAADPTDLFYKLGYREDETKSVGIFGKASLAGALLSMLFATLNKKGRIFLEEPSSKARVAMCWTYESIFFDTLSVNHIPPIYFPTRLDACPPPHEDGKGEVWSGKKIPVTGVWEPWSLDPAVGVRCPNYYLAGDLASQYQFEGTDTLEDVRWRLIWKDTRYEDGRIPFEEEDYFNLKPTTVEQPLYMRSAQPGQVCPESGEWFAPELKKTIQLNVGEVMPGPENGPSGGVFWYLKRPSQAPIGQ